jgi:hypothetical protein
VVMKVSWSHNTWTMVRLSGSKFKRIGQLGIGIEISKVK